MTCSFGSTVVRIMLLNDGNYPGDQRVLEIVAIKNIRYDVVDLHVSHTQSDRYSRDMSPCFAPIGMRVLWSREKGLTPDGQAYLDGKLKIS